MTEVQAQEAEPVVAAFAQHVRAFHASLPIEEQRLLEELFALAAKTYAGKAEQVSGYGVHPGLSGLSGASLFSLASAWSDKVTTSGLNPGSDPLLETLSLLDSGLQPGQP